jgi:pseudouridine kinase
MRMGVPSTIQGERLWIRHCIQVYYNFTSKTTECSPDLSISPKMCYSTVHLVLFLSTSTIQSATDHLPVDMNQPHILIVGAAGLDTKGRAVGPLHPGTSNPGSIRISVGGVARNVAENLARLGEHAILLSAVGADRSGRRVRDQATEAGVDVSHLIESADHHTGAYLAVLDQGGDLSISIDDMAVLSVLTPGVIYSRRSLIRDAAMVVLDANLSPSAINSLIRQATKYQVPISADPTSVSLAKRILPHLPSLFMVTPDLPEAEVLCNRSLRNTRDEGITAAKQLVAMGVQVAIVTLAELGVCYATSEVSGHVPAVKTQVVDRTGAGDALTAGVVFGLLNDFPIDEAVRLGASAAALTLQHYESVCSDLSLDCLYDGLVT